MTTPGPYDHLYDGEPWARLAREAGFRPGSTESSARSAFAFAAERLAPLEEFRDEIGSLLVGWAKAVKESGRSPSSDAETVLLRVAEALRAQAEDLDLKSHDLQDPQVRIDTIGGNCPVQAEGTIDGEPFYFRARGCSWSIGIGADPVSLPAWYCENPYGKDFDAGWMTITEARAFIEISARAWRIDLSRMANPAVDLTADQPADLSP